MGGRGGSEPRLRSLLSPSLKLELWHLPLSPSEDRHAEQVGRVPDKGKADIAIAGLMGTIAGGYTG